MRVLITALVVFCHTWRRLPCALKEQFRSQKSISNSNSAVFTYNCVCLFNCCNTSVPTSPENNILLLVFHPVHNLCIVYFVHSLARTQPNATHTYKHFCLCPHCIIHVTLHEELYQQKSGTLRRLEQGTHDSLSSCIIVRDLFCFKEEEILKLHVTQSGLGVYNQLGLPTP